ncbi:MAG: response regulator [Nitrospinae bacterium]|nr:response regulator [Nitrospinota bacterium]
MTKDFPILLVDDEEIILATVGRDLRSEGFEVIACKSGEEAVEKLQGGAFDIVITDLMMEGIDGLGVLKKAKEIKPETMVLVLTGFGSLSSAVDALRLGASDYLLKPCDRVELAIRVNHCVEKLRLRRKIKVYENILPICSICKKIRDDGGVEPGTGEWVPIEHYIEQKLRLDVSHGYCPDCFKQKEKEIDEFLKRQPRKPTGQ